MACTPGDPEVIDIDSLPDIKPKGKNAKWIQTSHYTLTNTDRECLVNSLAWLNDRIIEAAQAVLRKQSQVPGFQDICLGMMMTFQIQRQPFVQILHDGHGHWLTISSIGGKPGNTDISVYDSMYLSGGSYAKKQIAAIVCSKENTITLNMRNVQLQAGGSDCGHHWRDFWHSV